MEPTGAEIVDRVVVAEGFNAVERCNGRRKFTDSVGGVDTERVNGDDQMTVPSEAGWKTENSAAVLRTLARGQAA